MEKLMLHNNGIITLQGETLRPSVLKFLGSPVELDEHMTLAAFFLMIHHYPELKNISDILDPLLDIVSKSSTPGLKTRELDGLVFYKTIEIKGFPGTPSLTIYSNLKGVFNEKTKDLKFFHLETLLNHTLKLGKLNHVVFGDTEDIFQYDTFYTLFDLVEGIAWELSFNFNPLQCSIRR